MITLEKTEVMGWEAAIRGMRNPMKSWDKSDSYWTHMESANTDLTTNYQFFIGENDLDLMTRLRNAGTDHRKFMRMITVFCDITAPLYWWKQMDQYKIGTVTDSTSTMHKIHAKEFTMNDFSFEDCDKWTKDVVCSCIINALNMNRNKYLETGDKEVWRQLVQLLPSSYNQRRTVMLNYEVLANIYRSRKGHKLTEWHTLCDWIESLPYSELITG